MELFQFQPHSLHSGEVCQVFQLLMPAYCAERGFSTGSDRGAKVFKAGIFCGQLRLNIYIYITILLFLVTVIFLHCLKHMQVGWLEWVYIYIYIICLYICIICSPGCCFPRYLTLLQLASEKSQLFRWQSTQAHNNQLAHMLTECHNRILELGTRHPEVFFARRDCSWLKGFLYYLIHRASSRFTIEEWVDYIQNANARNQFFLRWTREEWAQ